MDRRQFLRLFGLVVGCLGIGGCGPSLLAPVEALVGIDDQPGNTPKTPSVTGLAYANLYINNGQRTRQHLIPWRPNMPVRTALNYARQQFRLDVGYGYHPTYGHYVNHLDGVTINAASNPTLLYALGTAPFTTGDAWYAALAGSYVDTAVIPQGGVIDWRLAVP